MAVAGTLLAQTSFTKITQGALVTDRFDSWYGIWGDYDGDGRPDVLVTGPANHWRLYHNDGGVSFSAVTNGVMNQRSLQGMYGAWGDPDNDGDLDFYAGPTSANESPAMYWNDGHGNFIREPVTASWTSNHITPRGLLYTWGDFDRDGFADGFLGGRCIFATGITVTNALLGNNCDGTFAVDTNSVPDIKNDSIQYVCAVDYDNDGSLDLVPVRHAGLPTQFYHNDGLGVFTEATPEPIRSEATYCWTAAWADFDNDGDLDLIFGGHETEQERFYVNDGHGIFSPWTGQPDRFENNLPAGWYGEEFWGDFDNDGYLDLLAGDAVRWHLWHNLGSGDFEEILTGSPVNDSPLYSVGACWVDFNNDGALDMFVANVGGNPNYLYQNKGNTNHWLEVKLQGMASDRMAVGAKVFATATIRGQVMRQLRVITANAVDTTLVAHFGLGDATKVDTLRVEWPIGIVQELANVAADQVLTVTEHQQGATDTPSLSASKSPDGALQLTAIGQSNLRYVFEASTNLTQWTKIAVRANQTGTVEFTPAASSAPQRFYRVVVP